jgi:hypothetical protein
MVAQIGRVCKIGFFQLRTIGKIRKFLTTSAAKCLVNALVLSHVDYANSLLVNLPEKLIACLQGLQNAAAKLVFGARKFDAKPIISRLRWLPIQLRVYFKLCVLTFRCLNDLAPAYLSRRIERSIPTRNLRSSTLGRLVHHLLEQRTVLVHSLMLHRFSGTDCPRTSRFPPISELLNLDSENIYSMSRSMHNF